MRQILSRIFRKSEVIMDRGPLVDVQIGNGQYVKMYEADAIAQGFLATKSKNGKKMRRPKQNKSGVENSTPEQPVGPADDFTTILGIGKGTARALAANGITTFEQLRQAGKLSFVTPATMQAVEAWRRG
jgi:hypothetical protein